jgi:hypothetical protein
MNRRLFAVAPVDGPGGAEIHLLRLLTGLASQGWEIALTTPDHGRLRDAALDAGYDWRALPVGGLGRGAGDPGRRSRHPGGAGGGRPYSADGVYTRSVLEAAAAHGLEHYPWSEEAPGPMRNLDVLVLPAYEEPFGTVLAEGVAVGTPVVATRADGLPEVVEDRVERVEGLIAA